MKHYPAVPEIYGYQRLGYVPGYLLQNLLPWPASWWIAAEHSLLSEFVKIKQSADLHTSNFDQGVADAYMEQYDLDEHVKEIVALYKHRRDLILESMEKYFPAGTEWTHPEGGLFLWLTFPEGVSYVKYLTSASR